MPNTRTSVFDRVTVDYSLRGTTRVTWALKPRFTDGQPYIFQLQVSRNGLNDWDDVGLPQENTYFALDDQRRLYGQDMRLTYRVQLVTPVGTYYSPDATVLGLLSRRQWLQAREMMRNLILQSRGMKVFQGYLLKRRIQGIKCPDCVDPMTDGIRNSSCATCDGTGFLDGYYKATTIRMYDMAPYTRETHNRGGTGTITTQAGDITGQFIGLPLIHNKDVWVDANSDRRYFVHAVQHLSEINQIPLAVAVVLRPAEFSDRIYAVNL